VTIDATGLATTAVAGMVSLIGTTIAEADIGARHGGGIAGSSDACCRDNGRSCAALVQTFLRSVHPSPRAGSRYEIGTGATAARLLPNHRWRTP
jgi:hypothetical protein